MALVFEVIKKPEARVMDPYFIFPPVVNLKDPWPRDISICKEKFHLYNERMIELFRNQDRYAETPKIYEWEMIPGKIYASCCLLFDVLHVYHHMGTLYWNEGIKNLREKQHKLAKDNFVLSQRYFEAISQRVLTNWNPSCRKVYQYSQDKKTKDLVFPSFLVGDMWKGLVQLCSGMIQRCTMEKAIEDQIKPALLAKLASAGYSMMKTPRIKLDPPILEQFYQDQIQAFKITALVNWAKSDDSLENVGNKVKLLNTLKLDMEKVRYDSWIGLEGLREEADKWDLANKKVHFQELPDKIKEEEVLDSIPQHDSTKNIERAVMFWIY